MDHGEAHLGILLDVILGYAQVQPPLDMGGSGAAGDHMQLRALLGDDNVVHPLIEVARAQIQAALDGKYGFAALLGPHEESGRLRFRHLRRIFVGIRGHQLPVVVLQEFVLLQGGGDIHHLHSLIHGAGHHRRLVHLYIGSGSLIVELHAHI